MRVLLLLKHESLRYNAIWYVLVCSGTASGFLAIALHCALRLLVVLVAYVYMCNECTVITGMHCMCDVIRFVIMSFPRDNNCNK